MRRFRLFPPIFILTFVAVFVCKLFLSELPPKRLPTATIVSSIIASSSDNFAVKNRFRKLSTPAPYEWSPTTIDQACPLFIIYFSGTKDGLGSQLEAYLFNLYVAKMAKATLVVEGFNGGPWKHAGVFEYRKIAEFLGIDFTYNVTYLSTSYGLKPQHVAYLDFKMNYVDRVERGYNKRPCRQAFNIGSISCGIWCYYMKGLDVLSNVEWLIRKPFLPDKCHAQFRHLPTSNSRFPLNMVWHVRQGDVCPHCDQEYFKNMKLLFDSVLPSYQYTVTFVSQKELSFAGLLKELFPTSSILSQKVSLLETVCTFLTADVLVTSGSSFAPLVAAFGQPLKPIVFEEKRKDAYSNDTMIDIHYYSKYSAVLIDNFRFVGLNSFEVRRLIESKFS